MVPEGPSQIHVLSDPDGPGWLVLTMTAQEAFDWDRLNYGCSVALANQEILREVQKLSPLIRLTPGPEG